MEKYSKSEIMKMAAKIRKEDGFSLSAAMVAAWKWAKWKRQAKQSQSKFAYTKVCGEVRQATGTINPLFFPVAKGSGKEKTDKPVQAYYDLGANGWRSFRISSLV